LSTQFIARRRACAAPESYSDMRRVPARAILTSGAGRTEDAAIFNNT